MVNDIAQEWGIPLGVALAKAGANRGFSRAIYIHQTDSLAPSSDGFDVSGFAADDDGLQTGGAVFGLEHL